MKCLHVKSDAIPWLRERRDFRGSNFSVNEGIFGCLNSLICTNVLQNPGNSDATGNFSHHRQYRFCIIKRLDLIRKFWEEGYEKYC